MPQRECKNTLISASRSKWVAVSVLLASLNGHGYGSPDSGRISSSKFAIGSLAASRHHGRRDTVFQHAHSGGHSQAIVNEASAKSGLFAACSRQQTRPGQRAHNCRSHTSCRGEATGSRHC